MDNTKVIFLDVDGVLNSHNEVMRVYKETGKKGGLLGTYDIHLKELQKLVKETDAKIVMSSTWRSNFNNHDIHFEKHITEKFKKLGLEVSDITTLKYMDRGLQINLWLEEHPEVKKFVVLDDETYDIEPHISWGHIIKTSTKEGLQESHVDLAIIKLNR